MRPHVLALPLALATLACRPNPAEPLPPPPPPTDHEAVREEMRGHFAEISAIKNAVIDGDLETVREEAEVFVSEQETHEYPEAWRPHVLEMIEVAQATATAPDIQAAASSTARLAATCGRCHRAVGAKPVFTDAVEPEEGDEVAVAMQRHQWAADRLWEGIVGPSEIAWARGSEVFPAIPGCATELDAEPDIEPRMLELCTRVSALGREGATTRELEDRARIYGELLGTCAACHTAAP